MTHFLDEDSAMVQFTDKKVDLSFGLHACGPLSVIQFAHAVKQEIPKIFNFGCCYYKMGQQHFNLSERAKKFGLQLTLDSLSVANRAHGTTSHAVSAFEEKLKVKQYRYAF